MNTTIDITGTEPINITPMSREEARECITAIKGNLESLRLMLLEIHRRKGWEALGYNSWEDCAIVEFGKSRSYVFQLLTAAQVEVNLTSNAKSTIVDLDDIPVSQLTVLAKLPPEQQAQGLLLAEEIAQASGKKRNAIHVAQAVKEIKPGRPSKKRTKTKDDEQQPADVDDAPNIPASLSQSSEELPGEVNTDHNHTFQPISTDVEQNYKNFVNSIESLNHNHIATTISALAEIAHTYPQKLVPLDDTELKSFISQLNLLTQTAETLLSKRHSQVPLTKIKQEFSTCAL